VRAEGVCIKHFPSIIKKKETPRRRNSFKTSSVSKSLQECNEHLLAISKCDDKIARFEELLKEMRTDLYGSIEAISERINQTATAMDPPKKKGVPRIVSNIQLVSPRPTLQQEDPIQDETDYCSDDEGWTEVRNRRNKKSVKIDAPPVELRRSDTDVMEVDASLNKIGRLMKQPLPASPNVRWRVPRAAAVSIKANADGASYADIIKRAREAVSLKDLGIANPRMRRAANGGIIIEISGPEGAMKADTLASRLREVIGDNAAVSRSVVKPMLK